MFEQRCPCKRPLLDYFLFMENRYEISCAINRANRIVRLFLSVLTPALFTFSAGIVLGQGNGERPYNPSRDNTEATADRIIRPAMREKQLPSLALGVVKNGRVAVKKSYGVRSLDSGIPPDENTVYYIGSLSKAVTAVGVMMLREQGKINLNA